jgi:hypothetical protein
MLVRSRIGASANVLAPGCPAEPAQRHSIKERADPSRRAALLPKGRNQAGENQRQQRRGEFYHNQMPFQLPKI